MRVRQLSEQLANQIAAGEVVARPASVVKELVENALDAGARSIRVEIEAGGTLLVRVVDDGCGIHPEDVALALARHATSKIASVEDLRAIATLGFRGEALPSIASVSRFRLRTRRREDDAGTEAEVEGGGAVRVSPCGTAPGTTVEVVDLFYNVPARRKFMRALATESAHVSEVLRCAALAHPEVQFELLRDGRLVRRWLSMPSLAERAGDVLHDVGLRRCTGTRGPVSIEAFLSTPDRARTGAGGLSFFVNARPIQDRGLARAVATAYGEALERGRYPVGAVFIEMPADLVDVNVHPQKAEVRFAQARALADALHSILRDDLPPRPLFQDLPPQPPLPNGRGGAGSWEWQAGSPLPLGRGARGEVEEPGEEPGEESGERLRLLGVVQDRFLVCHDHDGIVVVSLERARRVVLMERAREELARGGLVAQRLLFPVIRQVAPEIAEKLDGAVPDRIGFDVRRTAKDTLAVHAVPRIFASGPAELFLEEVIGAPAIDEDRLVTAFARITARAERAPDESEARALLHALGDRSRDTVVATILYEDL